MRRSGVRIPWAPPVFVRSVAKNEDCRAEVRSTQAGGCVQAKSLRTTTRQAIVSWMKFFYVYILQSITPPDHFYIGRTEDLRDRLHKHNAGEVPHTAKFRPWRIKTAIAFTDHDRAVSFERYLKSSSGRAFTKKRL
jgi:putative endonuclease